jgi:apolipoprotein N-acyltransferase
MAFLLVNLLGIYRKGHLPPASGTARVLVVQANIGNKQKHLAEHGEYFREAIIQKYAALTHAGLAREKERPDFVLWPETAFPDFLLEPELKLGLGPKLKSLVQRENVALLTGGFGFNGVDKITNSIFVIGRNGSWANPPYNKTILMPFGEFIPGGGSFPFFKKLLPHVRDFAAGAGPQVIRFEDRMLGFQICYEGLFDSFSGELARKGAEILVNVTNDSWYGEWQQPYQHFYMTMGRAVETRRPLIRSTNTGVSGVALADGTLLEASPLGQEWVHAYDVPYATNAPVSPFSAYGYWLLPSLLAALLGAVFFKKKSPDGNTIRA